MQKEPVNWREKIQKGCATVGKKKWYRHFGQRAAVSILLAEKEKLGLSFLMIERATHASDRWSGQMAFPGGKQDPNDDYIQYTALRELYEELAIGEDQIQFLGRLSEINARSAKPMQKTMVVSPFVYQVKADVIPVCNYEVADVLWIPLSHFNDSNRQTLTYHDYPLPCYFYQDKCVWGLSLMMIDELTNLLASVDLTLGNHDD